MEYLWWFLVQVFWWIEGVVAWVFFTLLWLIIWVLLPFAVLAFIAIQIADYVLGRGVVWLWLKKQSLKYGTRSWKYTRRTVFALTALPIRVLAYLLYFGLLHSIVSLAWQPTWSPWQRAWGKRWRKPT